jgi:S1-C subfamily serine protease
MSSSTAHRLATHWQRVMQMDEQHGGGEQPGAWAAWTTPAGQPEQAEPGQASEPAEGQRSGLGNAESPGQAVPAQPAPPAPPVPPGQPAALTQPIGYPGSGYADEPPGHYGSSAAGGYGQPPGGDYGYGGYGGPPPRRRRGLATAITYIAVAALAATAGGLVVSFVDAGNSSPPGASSGSGSGNNGGNFGLPGGSSNGQGNGSAGASLSPAALQKVEDAVEPGIVTINSNLQYSGAGAAGTGIIISKSGLVLTNNHVIDQTTGLSATVVATGQRYQAKWLGYDKGSDVAVIQLEGASGLRTAPLGDSSTVKVGDTAVGMGNAGGTGRIASAVGTITGVNQTITASDQGIGAAPERLTGMLQTDANIVSGDSGGPLASTAGKVIGVDTAASSGSFTLQQQSVGFAIPINKAMTIARQIISGKGGSGVQIGASGFVGVIVPAGRNGAQSTETNPQAQLQQQEAADQGQLGFGPPNGCVQGNQALGVPSSIAPVSSGTLVLGVICGTPAAQNGMVPGDVITSAAGQQVTSPASLTNILHGVQAGSTVKITWVTPSNQTITRTLTVEAAPPQ